MKSIIFIVNGAKKPNKKLKEILQYFSNSTFFSKVEFVFTQFPGHATNIASDTSTKFDFSNPAFDDVGTYWVNFKAENPDVKIPEKL